jgi:type IV pilus assembly protein PilA
LRSKKGFTLIELMIVVAIIGILAAIAIPNFMKFQCKSKQSEAKQNLGAIYVAMGSYYSNNDAYPDQAVIGTATRDCWYLMGWGPSGRTRYRYACGTGEVFLDADATLNRDPNLAPRSKTNCTAAESVVITDNTTGASGFIIAATGDLDTDNTCCDEWALNNAKFIKNQAGTGIATPADPDGDFGDGMNDCELDTCP